MSKQDEARAGQVIEKLRMCRHDQLEHVAQRLANEEPEIAAKLARLLAAALNPTATEG